MEAKRPFSQADWEATPGPVKHYIEYLEQTTAQLVGQVKQLMGQVDELTKKNQELEKRVEDLEAKLRQNSHNSDRPPSSDLPFERPTRKGKKGKAGAKKGHRGHQQEMLEPTHQIEVVPERCSCGRHHFDRASLSPYYTHQHIELPEIRMEVTHYILLKGHCPNCGKTVKGQVPRVFSAGYGPRLSGLVAELCGVHGVSREAVKGFCHSVLGFSVSLGGLQRIIDRVSAAIFPFYEEIGRRARASPVNHVDETSWFTKGDLKWLWTMTNADVSYFMVHNHRSKQAFSDLIQEWRGKLISDNYNVYTTWEGPRQSCLSHLIRRAKGLSERKKKPLKDFGRKVLADLRQLCRWDKDPPSIDEELPFWSQWWGYLTGHCDRKDEAGRLARLLVRHFKSLGLFLDDPLVEATNNAAERALRFPVLWRKRSKGTQSDKGERWVERMLSLKQTCRMRNLPTYPLLVQAVEDSFSGRKPQSLGLEPTG